MAEHTRGRPKSLAGRKIIRFPIRISESENDMLNYLAEKRKTSKAEVIRSAIISMYISEVKNGTDEKNR